MSDESKRVGAELVRSSPGFWSERFMNVIPKSFPEFLDRNGIAVGVVSFAPYERKQLFGNPDDLESGDIITQYFDDIPMLDEALQNRILPRMVQKGIVLGMISKPAPNAIVGLLYHDNRDAVQRYKHSKELDAELIALWKGADSE